MSLLDDPDQRLTGGTGMGQPAAFQFTDLRAMAAKILRRANDVAQQRLEAANKEIKKIETQAHEQGFQQGREEGVAKGTAEGRQSGEQQGREAFIEAVQPVGEMLTQLANILNEGRVALQAEAEADLLRLAMEIAKRVVRQEVRTDPESIRPIVREAIGLTTERDDLVIHCNPEDLAVIEKELPALRAAFPDLGRVRLEREETVERGGLRVAGRYSEIDMRLGEQFAALERALLGEESEAIHMESGADASVLGGPARPASLDQAVANAAALPPPDESHQPHEAVVPVLPEDEAGPLLPPADAASADAEGGGGGEASAAEPPLGGPMGGMA